MSHTCFWCRARLPDRAPPIAGEWCCELCGLLLNEADQIAVEVRQALRTAMNDAKNRNEYPAAIRAIGWQVLREATP